MVRNIQVGVGCTRGGKDVWCVSSRAASEVDVGKGCGGQGAEWIAGVRYWGVVK